MLAHRRMGRRGLRLLAGTVFVAGLIASPAASAASPVSKGVATSSMTAARVGRVNPLRDGVARSAGSGNAFGSPTSATRTSSLADLRQPGATAPRQWNLPHWLPGRATRTASNSATAAHPTGSARLVEDMAPTATAVAAVSGTGIRSDFGMYGLSDADDSILYPDCSVFELCEEPPDPGIAVSATSIVQSVNELILVVDRATNASRVIPNLDFFSVDSNQIAESDPKVIYDAGQGRWIATEISSDCGHSYLHMAVSATDDPFGNWNVYRLVFPGQVVDFPGVGTANSTVVVSLNVFGADPESPDCLSPGDFAGAMLAVIDWSQLTQGVASLTVTTTPPDPKLFTWRPATTAGGDPLARLIVAVDNGTDDTSDVGYATISGSNATHDVTVSPVINLTQTQGVAPFATPPAPHQPGKVPTIQNAVDGQPTDAIAASGHLWFIATAPCTAAGETVPRDCVRLTELLVGAGSAVGIGSDTRLTSKDADLYMGGVGRALDGTLYVVYSRSSETEQVADWTTWHRSTEAAFHDPALIVPAGGEYSGVRWGDYVIVPPDPATPDAVWQADEVSSVDGTWFTWISRIRPAAFGPLAGSVRINGGDTFTGDPFVDLQFTNPPDVALTVVRVSIAPVTQDGVLVDGLTMPAAADQPFSLDTNRPDGLLPYDGARSVFVQWGDGQGHWSPVATDSIILDTGAPTVGDVQPARIVGSSLGADGSVPVQISWGAGTDSSSGLEGYDVQISMDGLDFEDFESSTGTSVRGSVVAGHRYQWRVRSFDRVGNVSDWVDGPEVRIDAVDDRSVSLHFDSAWRRATASSAYRGGVHAVTKAGSATTLNFVGHGFALVGTVAPGRGAIDVIVDGRHEGTFVENGSSVRARQIGFRMTLASGRHTVRLVAVDGRRVDLDAVVLLR